MTTAAAPPFADRIRGMNEPSVRPFYKRKRWIAAGVLWLVVAYPLSSGPVAYCWDRGWLPNGVYQTLYWKPLSLLPLRTNGMTGYPLYVQWWVDLAHDHEPVLPPPSH